MFKVFISASSLERLCRNEMTKNREDQNSWFVILTKQNIIYLDKDVYKELDYDDPLFTFSESYNVMFKTSPVNYNEIVKTAPQKVLDNPQCAYLLDADVDTTDLLQKAFGIICQSTSRLKDCILTSPQSKITLLESEQLRSWKDLFNDGIAIPSNSLVVIDRYIFAYEGKIKCGYKDGVANIEHIIANTLPQKLACDYDILILFDESKSNDRFYSIDKVALELENFKNKLNRPYQINIELFSVSSEAKNYENTHNRKIISNYFIASADYQMKAFDKNSIATCCQDLRLEYAYSTGLCNRSDPAIKMIDYLLKNISEMASEGAIAQKNNSDKASEYELVQNGSQTTVDHIKNRLIFI